MFNRYPYTNFHELNLDYFIQHFNEIFTEWEQLYNELQSWKTDTTEELDQWRANVEEDLNDREAALRAELEIWKQETAEDISDWETATLNALDAWKTAATAQFEAIRVQAAASAEAAAASQTAAASAAAAALLSETAAEEAAAEIQSSAAQIQQNTDDISELKTQLNNIENDLYETFSVRVTAGVTTGAILASGVATTSNSQYIVKYDCTNIRGKTLTIRTTKQITGSAVLAICAFYDIPVADLTRSGATLEHVIGVGNSYPTDFDGAVTESIMVPDGANSMYISFGQNTPAEEGNDPYRPIISYLLDNDIKEKIEELETSVDNIEEIITKKEYQSGNIFFTVNCERPIPFNEGTILNSAEEEIECVLRLPTTYTPTGEKTRLVLCCHGSTGYIDSENDIWYNSNWNAFMNSIVQAGYAVFDTNIFSGADPDQIGFAVGSPLYAQVIKKAYDYIITNYNVYDKIFAHGTSMGGVGAKTFAHFFPQIVLAISSFAGRDICKYLHLISLNGIVPYSGRFSVSYGYADDQSLLDDKFSHVVGLSDSLGLLEIDNGNIIYPPDRETDFINWTKYYAKINNQDKNSNLTKWIGYNAIPYKSWNDWADEEESTAQELLMQNAYSKTGGKPYYAVVYDNGYSHTQMSYGQVENMRSQLIEWYKRWE